MALTMNTLSQRSTLALAALPAFLTAAGLCMSGPAAAQSRAATLVTPDWQACQALTSTPQAQLLCYQNWASAQTTSQAPVATAAPASAGSSNGAPAATGLALPALAAEAAPDGKPIGCRNNKYSELSKFWELQRGTDCDTFALRGYRPTSIAVTAADSVNKQPSAPSVGHTALTAQDYNSSEAKIQVSVRTKIAKGLLKSGTGDDDDQDSLWFGYTAQSYWQVFTPSLSRPFRNTDHEPEAIYIYPHQIALPGGWNYRLSGLGLVHQSNGQSLPLSRSWNRAYLMGAAEKVLGEDSSLTLQGRIWDRLRESTSTDDNPGIEDYIGRAEVAGNWQINRQNSVGVTVRHSLRKEARGSVRLDWMRAPNSQPNYTGLRYHVQLFNGYGDSLIDYNRKRTVLSVGLSLVDW